MNNKSLSIGVQYGLLAALLYCILLFLRYNFFATGPLSFGIAAFVSYLIILVIYFLSGKAKKKEQGGYIEFKQVFQTIFIAILIAETAYTIFNFIYLKYIEPNFFEKFAESTRGFMEKQGVPDEQIDKQMEQLDNASDQLSPINILKGWAMWIVVDSVFGLIFSLILKKKKDFFETQGQTA